MAETKSEIDVINHLLQVEKEASLLIEQAVDESTKKVSAAKTKANALLQEKISVSQKELEADYENKVNQLNENHSSLLQDFEKELSGKKQNVNQFNTLFKDLLATAK